MDLVLMGALSAFGSPALTCFSIVGDTVARFFSTLGTEMAGGVPTGIAAHYLIGPLFGVHLWHGCNPSGCPSSEYSEKVRDPRSFVCRDPEPADPCDDPHPAEDDGTCDAAVVRWILRDAFDDGDCPWYSRGLRSAVGNCSKPQMIL